MSRLETLRRIAAQRPTDPFPRYGLAMELKQQGQLEEAVTVFRELQASTADYVPQYLMHGQLLTQLGREAEARRVLSDGLAVATQKGDGHAASELQSALAELGTG
jgi:Flp pilus assembly protein TadD